MEDFVDVVASLGGGFEEEQAVVGSQLPPPLCLNHLVRFVALVGHQHLRNILAGVLVYLLEPVLDVSEGLLVGAVVDQDDAHGSLVVGLRDGAEPLLASSVPHLQLHALLVHVDLLDFEVNA